MKNATPNQNNGNEPERRLLKSPEAAKFLRIGERHLWSLTNCGDICHVRFGRNVRYDIKDLHEWIETNKHGGK